MTVISLHAFAMAAGHEPAAVQYGQEAERMYRARFALNLGLSHDDIRCVFDLSEEELARLAAEVSS